MVHMSNAQYQHRRLLPTSTQHRYIQQQFRLFSIATGGLDLARLTFELEFFQACHETEAETCYGRRSTVV